MKVCLACQSTVGEEEAQAPELQIKQLEVEADKAVHLRWLAGAGGSEGDGRRSV